VLDCKLLFNHTKVDFQNVHTSSNSNKKQCCYQAYGLKNKHDLNKDANIRNNNIQTNIV